jgi:cobalamin-dependent methionine synthase I
VNKEDFSERAKQVVLNGDEDAAVEVANKVIAERKNLLEIIDEGFTQGMIKVADLFANEELALTDVLIAAKAFNKAIKIMEPFIPAETVGRVVVRTKGIFLGKRILVTMQPLSKALTLMESTRYTWPPLLWHLTHRVQHTFEDQS